MLVELVETTFAGQGFDGLNRPSRWSRLSRPLSTRRGFDKLNQPSGLVELVEVRRGFDKLNQLNPLVELVETTFDGLSFDNLNQTSWLNQTRFRQAQPAEGTSTSRGADGVRATQCSG